MSLRFPHLYRDLGRAGADVLSTVPSAFTVPTGRAHWHVLLRARAIEGAPTCERRRSPACTPCSRGRRARPSATASRLWARCCSTWAMRPRSVSSRSILPRSRRPAPAFRRSGMIGPSIRRSGTTMTHDWKLPVGRRLRWARLAPGRGAARLVTVACSLQGLPADERKRLLAQCGNSHRRLQPPARRAGAGRT